MHIHKSRSSVAAQADTHTYTRLVTAERQSYLLRVEYLIGSHTEFRPLVSVDSNAFHSFGGLVVLPRH